MLCDIIRLKRVAGIAVGIELAEIQKMQLAPFLGVGIDGAAHERFLVIVVHVAACAAHKLGKDEVDAFGHGFAGAEVFGKNNFGRIRRMLRRIGRVLILEADEDFRHRLAETVDALLDVAHTEQIVACDGAKQHVLGTVGILVFVDQDFVERICNLFGKVARHIIAGVVFGI